jgi:hypothetical protein
MSYYPPRKIVFKERELEGIGNPPRYQPGPFEEAALYRIFQFTLLG